MASAQFTDPQQQRINRASNMYISFCVYSIVNAEIRIPVGRKPCPGQSTLLHQTEGLICDPPCRICWSLEEVSIDEFESPAAFRSH
jgi:hypothetical protein